MDSLLKVLVTFGSGAAALFAFLLGCAVGAFVWSRLRKPWLPEGKDLADAIDRVSAELKKTDHGIGLLWARANFNPEQRGTPTDVINLLDSDAHAPNDLHPLTMRIINIRRRLESLRGDLDSVIPWLCASQTRQSAGDSLALTKESRATIPITRRGRDEQVSEIVSDPHQESLDSGTPTAHTKDIATDVGEREFSSTSRPENQRHGTATTTEVIELYNRAVTDPLASEHFRERYQPVRIGTVNAVERRQNPTIKEEFRETTDGDFFALPIPGTQQHAVVPRLGLTIEAVSYNAGALGKVFNNPTYDSGRFYSHYRVRRAAIFKCDGDHWEFLSPGELDLGPGD